MSQQSSLTQSAHSVRQVLTAYKPKVVTSNGEAVRDALVRVGPADPNYAKSEEGVVRVKRNDFVTIRMDLWEEQQRQKAEERLHRKMIDPCRMGHWGPIDED